MEGYSDAFIVKAGGPTGGGIVLSVEIASGGQATQSPKTQSGRPAETLGSAELHSLILESLEDDVALDIVSIPLAGKSSEADMMVVASGRSSRHVTAIAEKLMDRLKQDAGVIARIEGKDSADWLLIDTGDVIVHIFRPEVRDFYQLEKMWQTAPDEVARAEAR